MKTRITFMLFLAIGLFWQSCSCPPDEQTGEISLTELSLQILPYDGSETLSFLDEMGVPLDLTAPRGEEINTDQLCYRTTCTEAKFDSPSSCEYYAAESRRYSYFSSDNSIVIDLLVYSDVYEYGEPLFYDALQVAFSSGSPSIEAGYAIEPRFTGEFATTELGINRFLMEQESVELNGQSFTDVLVHEEGNLAIYLQEGVGVIAFKDANHTWVLQ